MDSVEDEGLAKWEEGELLERLIDSCTYVHPVMRQCLTRSQECFSNNSFVSFAHIAAGRGIFFWPIILCDSCQHAFCPSDTCPPSPDFFRRARATFRHFCHFLVLNINFGLKFVELFLYQRGSLVFDISPVEFSSLSFHSLLAFVLSDVTNVHQNIDSVVTS